MHFSPLLATLRHYIQTKAGAQALFAVFECQKRMKYQGKIGFLKKNDKAQDQTKA
jgi:hypothetical protein